MFKSRYKRYCFLSQEVRCHYDAGIMSRPVLLERQQYSFMPGSFPLLLTLDIKIV